MTYLLDSDQVADYLKGRQSTLALVRPLVLEGASLSIISYGEIYEGILHGLDPERHKQGFEQFIAVVRVRPLTRAIMREFARIRGELRRQGLLIPDADLLIAATAVHSGLTLVTRNRRHFDRVPGLALHPAG